MHEEAARKLIKETFNQSYSHDRFRKFIRELTKNYEDRNTSGQVPNNFKDSIQSVFRIGKFVDAERNEIDILAVTLAKDTSLDRARTLQRNFVARHLSHRDKEAALVAFVSPDSNSWRFSLVRRELSLARNLKGKTKALPNFSPARRFSFLVGENEHTHTAQRQLIDLLKSDNRPTLKTLEKAFNIEQVTEEFFEEYRELFNRVNEKIATYLKDHPDIQAHFIERDIEPADFAKRLLGQIVFLYFLQKKGWLGVPRKAKWGEGSRTFLRDLYNKAESEGKNFFDSYLKHLFYDALNHDRSDVDHYYSMFDCRIPFLNGGLFEPYHDYKWEQWDIKLPNTLFHELGSSLFGEDGKGILDVFDRYNFTVAEDEPLEREVAIDPEMLGKVFEKLLPVKERGKLGTFYTPREIVHYMCQESLIAYLFSHFPALDKTELDDFIRYGDLLMEHDSKILRDGVSETYKDFFLGATIRANLKEIDEALKTVKVCDPAIGSGAFPVGMMSEIVRARKVLAAHMRHERPSYDLKRETIQESLYGVDLDPGAIEIAKLRLWLSLVVDEDNFDQIQALPNLDYKIMQGNSLLQSYEGIKLFEDALLKQHDHTARRRKQLEAEFKEMQDRFVAFITGSASMSNQKERNALEIALKKKKKDIDGYLEKAKTQEDTPLFAKVSKALELAERLKKLHHDFFDTDRPKKKKELKAEIETLEWQLIETSLREKNKADKIPDIQKLQRHNVKPYFLWKLHFNEVFTGDNGGFDIVIANPPYVGAVQAARDNNSTERELYKEIYNVKGAFDLYVLFLLLGYQILSPKGQCAFIIPNKFKIAQYAKETFEHLKQSSQLTIVDVSTFEVFKDVGVYPIILSALKTPNASFQDLKVSNYGELERRIYESNHFKVDLPSIKAYLIKISSGLTGFQAQSVVPYICNETENTDADAIPFLVSGCIDPYSVDRSKVRYMGKVFSRPYIMKNPHIAASKWNMWCRPKIIIAGMTKRLEAIYSEEPQAIGVGCYAITDFNGNDPWLLLGILNSKLMTYYLINMFKDKHLQGGYLAINKSTIESLPLPKNLVYNSFIVKSASEITSLKKQNPDADVSALEAAINAEVYKLYHLTDAEIAIIEQAVSG